MARTPRRCGSARRWTTSCVMTVVLQCWALVVAVAAHEASATVRDARGLEFVSREAFCDFHCRATHVHIARRALAASECTIDVCGSYLTHHGRATRLLQAVSSGSASTDGFAGQVHADARMDTAMPLKTIQHVDFLSCRRGDQVNANKSTGASAKNVAARVRLAIHEKEETNVFQGFYDAFFEAYDMMVRGANASYDACHLQFLQEEFLANFTDSDKNNSQRPAQQPMLIKFHRDADQLECVQAVKAIWTPDDEKFTPFLTRSDQNNTSSTIMLMHINNATATKILDLDCINSVSELPAILKLTPFARSSLALARDSTRVGGPSLEITLVKNAAASAALTRLQARMKQVTGITNVLTTRDKGRVLVTAPLDEFETWARVTAIAVDDSAVEWVDLQVEITIGALTPGAAFEQRLLHEVAQDLDGQTEWLRALSASSFRQEERQTRRRLDEYVQDLIGVEDARRQGITGNDIIVGVTDTGLCVNHDQFDQESRAIYDAVDMDARKVIMYSAFANTYDESEHVLCGHGTHVSGILAGSSKSKEQPDLGIASSARIAFMDIGKQSQTCRGQQGCSVHLETPGDVKRLMRDQVLVKAKVFSFSWGTSGSDYSVQARDLDDFIYNNPEVLIVVAAGNSGEKGNATISSPSGAKNVISVGASLNDAATFSKTLCPKILNKYTVASFSSAGPTLDGRQKPDVVAPGMIISSAQSEAPGSDVKTSSLCPLQGTSQATPVVAGMAVLLYEWLRDGWWKAGVKDKQYGLTYIPASLLKALIIHSGERMEHRLVAPRNGVTSCVAMESAASKLTKFPNFDQGYGKPSMSNIASFAGNGSSDGTIASGGVYFYPNHTNGSEPSVKEGEELRFGFTLVKNTNLRVTIVWTDPAGSLAGHSVLQNDIDLFVRIPHTSKVFYPLSGNGERDSKNNVEMVEVSYDDILAVARDNNVQPADDGGIAVEAIVYGHSVKANPMRGQTFALVASSSPTSVEARSRRPNMTGFWQPWMTIGIIVACTMMALFFIALIWRIQARRAAMELKHPAQLNAGGSAPHATYRRGVPLAGAGNGGSGRTLTVGAYDDRHVL